MPGYMDYFNELNKSKSFGAPEKSYLYSDSSEMGFQPPPVDLGGQKMAQTIQKDHGVDGTSLALSAGSGAAMGGPAGAAIQVGGQILSQYMAQKAADERARRQQLAQVAQEHSAGEMRAIGYLQDSLKGALR